jgi:hypothetical protein
MKTKLLLAVILVSLLLVSCVTYYPTDAACLQGKTYGFWGGLWHGVIAPFDFIGMLIWDDVALYAPNNNGPWYALGFLMGSGGTGFLGGRGLFGNKKKDK